MSTCGAVCFINSLSAPDMAFCFISVFISSWEDININKDKVIFVYCKSGRRSEIAYNNLKDLGYEVYDLGAFSNVNLTKE